MTESTAIGRGTRAAIWVGFYVLCWLLMGLSCRVDLPHDCRRASEPMEVLIELPVLLAFALGQAVLCDILDGPRFEGLISKAYFPVVVVASGLIISAFNEVDELRELRDADGNFSALQTVISVALVTLVCFVLLYHFLLAWRHLPGAVLISGGAENIVPPPERQGENQFVEYCVFRGMIVAYFILFGVFAFERDDGWEYHYVLLAWVLSLVARFNDTLSVVWLGVTTAMFLQGIGAYSLRFLSPERFD